MKPIKHSLVILTPVIVHPGAVGISETDVNHGPSLVIEKVVWSTNSIDVHVRNCGDKPEQFSGLPPVTARKPWWKLWA